MTRLTDDLDNPKTWSAWWFFHGGQIHGHWKYRRYAEIKKLATELPKMAWDFQQAKIDELEAELALLRFNKWDAENGHKRTETDLQEFREKIEKRKTERGGT